MTEEELCENCGEELVTGIYECPDCGQPICEMCGNACRKCKDFFCDACYHEHKKGCKK